MKHIVTALCALLCVLSAAGQSIESLNAEIERTNREIAKNEALLNTVKKSRKTNSVELRLLGERITKRQKVVTSLDGQMKLITKNVSQKERDIERCNGEIAKLKKEYAAMLYASYKDYKLNNTLLFLFSADDFNSATRRVYFMQRYNNARREKADEITSASKTLEADIIELNLQREALEKTKDKQKQELSALEKDRKERDATDQKLKKEAQKISKTIKAREAEKLKAQKQLQKIIDEETRKNNRKMSDAERRAVTALNGRFDQNKGKMITPVDGGVVIDHFGVHPHPTQRNMKVDNKGVNIAAPKGSSVYSVFEGTVARVMFINGLNKCVLINHGDYFTLYSNLTKTTVSAGDKVSANKIIGEISSGDDPEEYQLHFEVWRSTNCLNPEEWLAK